MCPTGASGLSSLQPAAKNAVANKTANAVLYLRTACSAKDAELDELGCFIAAIYTEMRKKLIALHLFFCHTPAQSIAYRTTP